MPWHNVSQYAIFFRVVAYFRIHRAWSTTTTKNLYLIIIYCGFVQSLLSFRFYLILWKLGWYLLIRSSMQAGKFDCLVNFECSVQIYNLFLWRDVPVIFLSPSPIIIIHNRWQTFLNCWKIFQNCPFSWQYFEKR